MRAQFGNIDATYLIVYKIISTTFANNESHVVRCLAKWKKWSLKMETFEFNPNSIEKVLAVLFYTWERSISKQQQQTLSLHNSRTRFIAVRSFGAAMKNLLFSRASNPLFQSAAAAAQFKFPSNQHQ